MTSTVQQPDTGTAIRSAPPDRAVPHRPRPAPTRAAAHVVTELAARVLGGPLGLSLRCWDDTARTVDGAATLLVQNPRAVRRMLYAPGQLGLARAYVSGDLDFDGDVHEALQRPEVLQDRRGGVLDVPGLARLAVPLLRLGVLGPPPPPPPEEARVRGPLHSPWPRPHLAALPGGLRAGGRGGQAVPCDCERRTRRQVHIGHAPPRRRLGLACRPRTAQTRTTQRTAPDGAATRGTACSRNSTNCPSGCASSNTRSRSGPCACGRRSPMTPPAPRT